LKGALDTILISVGDKLLPVLTNLAKSLTPILQSFTELPDPVIKLGVVFGALLAAIGPVLMVLGQVVTGAAAIAPVVAGVAGTVSGILPILAAVAAAVGALFLAWQTNFLGIQDITRDVASKIPDWLGTAREKLGELAAKIGETFEAIRAVVAPVLQEIGAALIAFWEEISPKLSELAAIIKEKVGQAFEKLGEIVQNVVTIITPTIEFIVNFIAEHGDEIKAIFQGLFDAIIAIARVFGTVIGGAIKLILDLLTGDFESFGEDARTLFTNLWNALVDLGRALLSKIIPAVATIMVDLKKKIKEKFEDIIKAGRNLASDFVQGIINGIKSRIEDLLKVIQRVRDLLPGSLAREGPFSRPVEWDDVILGDLPKVTARVEHVFASSLAAATMPGIRAGHTTNISHSRTVVVENVTIRGGEADELQRMFEDISLRTI